MSNKRLPDNPDFPNCSFVLSTGRTGTTFLAEFLEKHFPALESVQEPPGSWAFQIYSNFFLQGSNSPAFRRFVQRHYLRDRSRLWTGARAEKYVEINPFLYGCADVLGERAASWKVLHLVRHPFTFIPSILNFKPRSWRVWFMHAPLWNPDIRKASGGCGTPAGPSAIENRAWQWLLMNQKIRSYEGKCARYERVLYEDLFYGEEPARRAAWEKVADFLGLEKFEIPAKRDIEKRVNGRQRNRVPGWDQWDARVLQSVIGICGDEMRRLGYDLHAPRVFGVPSGKA